MRINHFRYYDIYPVIRKNVRTINKELNESDWHGRFQIIWRECEGYATGALGDFILNVRIVDKKTKQYTDSMMTASFAMDIDTIRDKVIFFIEKMMYAFPDDYYDDIDYRFHIWGM